MHHVYILYSRKLNRFYIGNTDLLPEKRLEQHNSSFNAGSFTTKGIPWILFLKIPCRTRLQARQVELHIKKMKSRKYINNLQQYAEMRNKLLKRFDSNSVS